MGCYPLGDMISKALRRHKCRGKQRSRIARTVRFPPSPPTTYYGRSMAKTVTFSDRNHIITMPPEHVQEHVQGPPESEHYPETVISATTSPHTCSPTEAPPEPVEIKEPKQVRFTERPNSHGKTPRRSQRESPVVFSGAGGSYMASPLPIWQDEECRRREYFSREYYCYPTPIREGIYSFATDANRLTNMFSEENPNACNII